MMKVPFRTRSVVHAGALAVLLGALACWSGCAHDDPSPSHFSVVSISPADGATSVSTDESVQIVFNQEVHPDSVQGTYNIIVVNEDNQVLSGVFSVSADTVTFAPRSALDADTTYGVAVKRGVFNLEGVSLQYPKAARFSTGATVETIKGFPPFEEYPDAPDASKITAEIRGAATEVRGAADAVERPENGPVNVNLRNLTSDGDWFVVSARADGSFHANLPAGDEGDVIEINASFPETEKVGPSVTVTAMFPFSWTAVGASGTAPSARQGHTAVLDAPNRRMIVFGGCTNALGVGSARNDVFALSLDRGSETWTELSPSGTAPPARYGHGAVYDASGDRMIVFGGDNGALGVLDDVWALSLDTPGAEAWDSLAPSGVSPDARALCLAVYDGAGDRMIVFGGRGAQGLDPPQFEDLWALNLPSSGSPSWEALSPGGTGPTARSGLFGVLDPASRRMVAGFGSSGTLSLPDTYLLDVSTTTWTPVFSVPTTTGRGRSAATLDSIRGRVLVFGGGDTSASFDDLFAYDLGAGSWSSLSPEGSGPSPRSAASLVFDPVEGRSILFGGADLASTSVYGDLFALR